MQVLIRGRPEHGDYKELGVATPATTFFRPWAARSASRCTERFSPTASIRAWKARAWISSPRSRQAAQGLPQALHDEYVRAVMEALQPVYVVAAFIVAVGHLLTWFVEQVPLRGVIPAENIGESFAMPRDASSLDELDRIMTNLTRREERWRNYAEVAERIKVDLSAPEVWLLYRLNDQDAATPGVLAAALKVPEQDLAAPLRDLAARGFLETLPSGAQRLSSIGCEVRGRALAARDLRLTETLARWEPERHPEVKALFQRFREELSSELPMPKAS